ncbi:TM0106 family RecB-like putative nuclease [Mycolicibacterium sp. 141076]|uniref:TM0106 family RecB-like putative nuclease n=1 Tax=Mycolicibacterium sp. 141076 TaxID=3090599 RepID=UPI00299DF814|nr:TM0106 family RecB-like putative nuclease [Mycolicibacterium sp. 141076]MDX1878948.1 TM0106 family RecB-like putative nuclease [Mycolicibacterium sp. 141076]
MSERLLTPSKVTAWLDCAHYLSLQNQVDDGTLAKPNQPFGSFAQLLADKGIRHEADCLADYRRQQKSIYEVPAIWEGEKFARWVQRVGNPMADGCDVIYQMPFVHDGIRGIADFLIRVQDSETGVVSYEPVDAKLARKEAKPGHLLQLCFYADAVEALTGIRPALIHIWLGSGVVESYRVDEFSAYWRRLRNQLRAALAAGPTASTAPARCTHCQFCEFSDVCENQWRDEDSLIYVAGIRANDIEALTTAGIKTLTALAQTTEPITGARPLRLARLIGQAALQLQAQREERPPFTAIEPVDETDWGRGLEKLPQPDDGDVFLDFEGHPFWRADTGLFFLFGLIERTVSGTWEYREWWAHNPEQEAEATAALIDHLAARRVTHPGMHVYHYNHTERSSLETLVTNHGVRQDVLAELVGQGVFVDLYPLTRNSFQVGTESYGLKSLERLTDFERSHEIDKGAGAVVQYEKYMAEGDARLLTDIARYNEDDVRATMALRDWLVERRPGSLEWFVPEPEPEGYTPSELIVRLHEFDSDSVEYLLGDLLGYWSREWWAYYAPKRIKLQADPEEVLDDAAVITALQYTGLVERTGAQGRRVLPSLGFTFPPQALDDFPTEGDRDRDVHTINAEGQRFDLKIARFDRDAGLLELVQSKKAAEDGHVPSAAVLHEWVSQRAKTDTLEAYATGWLDGNRPATATAALLRRDLPQFRDNGGPVGGVFTDDIDDMCRWVTQLDTAVVGIQGPPGAGKTYSATHLIYTLITAGQRVGITATSHHAIINVLRGVVAVFAEKNQLELLRGVYKPAAGSNPVLPGIDVVDKNPACADPEYNLVAGTTWLFASSAMQAAPPVDVLLVDEAGQMSLADAAVASTGARNMILLGDPLQLPQVAQASHPGHSGLSVLDYLLGEATTMPSERGVFLSTTYRMHPAVCQFISTQFYQGRLASADCCLQQNTAAGTGLRWLRAEHTGRSTYSPEEADLVVNQISALIGTSWTNQHGAQNPLTASDFMVVVPYNDQVRTVKQRLGEEPALTGVRVGTVDKFQGGEAAVVLFSMTASSRDNITRGADFLFSRHRLNVAVSRARCLAYLTCTEELLNARARDVDEMRLIGTLAAYVEVATR